MIHRPDHHRVDGTRRPWRTTPSTGIRDPWNLQTPAQIVLTLPGPHETHRQSNHQLWSPAHLAHQASRLGDRCRCVAYRQNNIIAPLFPRTAYSGRRPRDAGILRQHMRLAVMHATPDIDVELLQKGALETTRDHRHISHDTPTAQECANPDFYRARRKKQFIDYVEVAARMNETLRHTFMSLGHTRPITASLDNPEALRLDRMRLIPAPLRCANRLSRRR